jgi:hypothetical protein
MGIPNESSASAAPLYAARNTATRWLTTVNYDLLIYDDRLVVTRGISWKTAPDDLRARRKAGSAKGAGEQRVAKAAATPIDEMTDRDGSNRVVPADEVTRATLKRGIMLARLQLELRNGDQLRYSWVHRGSVNGEYARIEQALGQMLGAKLQIDQ